MQTFLADLFAYYIKQSSEQTESTNAMKKK